MEPKISPKLEELILSMKRGTRLEITHLAQYKRVVTIFQMRDTLILFIDFYVPEELRANVFPTPKSIKVEFKSDNLVDAKKELIKFLEQNFVFEYQTKIKLNGTYIEV